MITHDTKIRVWYKHTDQMGFVHHSNYICYYEEARSDLMRSMGLSYADMERKGIIMPILEVQSVYKRPAFFDDCLTVRILLREMPTARIRFEYEVYNSQGDPAQHGHDGAGFSPCRHAPSDTRSAMVRRGARCGDEVGAARFSAAGDRTTVSGLSFLSVSGCHSGRKRALAHSLISPRTEKTD